jgi:hypothetical protein
MRRLTDLFMETFSVEQQQTDRPARSRAQNALDCPSGQLQERGGYEGHMCETSLYTAASLHPFVTGAVVAATALAFLSSRSRRRSRWQRRRPHPNGRPGGSAATRQQGGIESEPDEID